MDEENEVKIAFSASIRRGGGRSKAFCEALHAAGDGPLDPKEACPPRLYLCAHGKLASVAQMTSFVAPGTMARAISERVLEWLEPHQKTLPHEWRSVEATCDTYAKFLWNMGVRWLWAFMTDARKVIERASMR